MNKTGIEYLTHTWNPAVMRCTKISEACKNCWHLKSADRLSKNPMIEPDQRKAYAGERDPILVASRLAEPLIKRAPFIIGVQFMGDLFALPFDWIAAIFGVMAFSQNHTFVVLTKRYGRMAEFFSFHDGDYIRNYNWWLNNACQKLPDKITKGIRLRPRPSSLPLPNVIGMVTVENQYRANERLPALLASPFAMRGVSVEPMLGAVNITKWLFHMDCDHYDCDDDCGVGLNPPYAGLNWVVNGGEQGPNPMHPDWPLSLRDQCVEAGVAYNFKQWGDWAPSLYSPYTPGGYHYSIHDPALFETRAHGKGCHDFKDGRGAVKIGKKKAGRLLDGKVWDQYPGGINEGK